MRESERKREKGGMLTCYVMLVKEVTIVCEREEGRDGQRKGVSERAISSNRHGLLPTYFRHAKKMLDMCKD